MLEHGVPQSTSGTTPHGLEQVLPDPQCCRMTPKMSNRMVAALPPTSCTSLGQHACSRCRLRNKRTCLGFA